MSDSSDSAKSAKSDNDNGDNVTQRRPKKVRVSTDAYKNGTFNPCPSLKIVPFSPDEPEIWFALLEGQFDSFGITEDNVKFTHVITALDIQHAKAVKDLIINPPATNRYAKIKTELVRRLSASQELKVKQLLTGEALGDRKPSQFLRHLQDLAGPSVPEDFIRTIWSNRLPQNIQTVLASQTYQALEQLADLADRIQEITSSCNVAATSSSYVTPGGSCANEIAELRKMVERLSTKLDEYTREPRSSNDRSRTRNRSVSSSRSGTRSRSSYRRHPVCWYHSKFGPKAHKCQKPCDYEKSGNDMGGR